MDMSGLLAWLLGIAFLVGIGFAVGYSVRSEPNFPAATLEPARTGDTHAVWWTDNKTGDVFLCKDMGDAAAPKVKCVQAEAQITPKKRTNLSKGMPYTGPPPPPPGGRIWIIDDKDD
jgi:hypothetical protein